MSLRQPAREMQALRLMKARVAACSRLDLLRGTSDARLGNCAYGGPPMLKILGSQFAAPNAH